MLVNFGRLSRKKSQILTKFYKFKIFSKNIANMSLENTSLTAMIEFSLGPCLSGSNSTIITGH